MEFKQRKNHRLKNYDYGKYGYYYVTICTLNRENILSNVIEQNGATVSIPTALGIKIIEYWNNIELLNENVKVDKYILMPNHIHGIIIIENQELCLNEDKKYSFEILEKKDRRSLQGLVKDFKSVTTRYYKKMFDVNTSLWQESFYDEIINKQNQYEKVCKYIEDNPLNWLLDDLYK